MRFNIQKSRMPLILFAILCILSSIVVGLYYMDHMTQYSYLLKMESYHSLTKNVARLVKQEYENNIDYLEASADLIAHSGGIDNHEINTYLPIISQKRNYEDLCIVSIDGMGYNITGKKIDISKEDYFIKMKSEDMLRSDIIIYKAKNNPAVTLTVPVVNNGKYSGALIAKLSPKLNIEELYQKDLMEGVLIYIIDENHELIGFGQHTDIKAFDYDLMTSSGFLLMDKRSISKKIKLKDVLFKNKEGDQAYTWDEAQLGFNGWSVLVGKKLSVSPLTKDILRLTNLMWIIITSGTLFLIILLIIFERSADHKLVKMMYLDPVTGGDNWYKFRLTANKVLNSKQYHKRKYALVNFDINRFKVINDAYGYQKGDEILKDIYNVIKRWSRPGEPYTRYAADQFYIMTSFYENEDLTERIHELDHKLHKLRFTSSTKIYYGIYHITDRRDSIDHMGEFSSIAKNKIKGSTKGIIAFFDDAARDRLLEEEEIERTASEALQKEEFHVYLQPKVSPKEETVKGAEALVRWCKSNGRIISPGNFIPVFEKNGFITELDYYMLKKVCEIIRNWIELGYDPIPISVNISRLHFANAQLADIIRDIVDKYDVPHYYIELELTESAFLQNKHMMVQTVTKLREYGFIVSMDDFGAGYSSLNSLKDLPLDIVKLDGELFRMTDEVERGLTVIRNTITMAKDLHMMVVAECIETKEQVDFLCHVGCDVIQGYYYAKPMPVRKFEEMYF